jgi:hypothetical protein
MLCNDHNQRAAEEQIGAEHMDRARRRAGASSDLRLALKTAGFRAAEARSLADSALRSLGPDAVLTDLMREALRAYPLPPRACEERVLYSPRLVSIPERAETDVGLAFMLATSPSALPHLPREGARVS